MTALHPQVQNLLDMAAAAGARPLSEGGVEAARLRPAAIMQITGTGPEMVEERDIVVPSGDAEVPARLYRPGSGTPPGVVVYFHGGGWMVGEVSHFDGASRRLAAASGCDVLSVGYRLAPEHCFPAAADDASAAIEWASAELADGRPLIVVGDSSGGNIATVAARRARDGGRPAIALQVLIYPVTDSDFETDSYLTRGDGSVGLCAADMQWFWEEYVPDPALRRHEDAAPLRAADLSGMPPALVIVAEYDPLRDDGLGYAQRLSEAGNEVTLSLYEDVNHGFFTMAGYLDRGDDAVAEIAAAIERVVAQDGAASSSR